MYFDKEKVSLAFSSAYRLLTMARNKKFHPLFFVLGAGIYYQMKQFNNYYLAPPLDDQQGEETLFGIPIKLTSNSYTIILELDEFTLNLEKDFI